MAPIALKKGAEVTAQVNDVSQLLPMHEGKTAGAHWLMGVSVDGNHFAACGIDVAGFARTQLPFDRSLKLIDGRSLFNSRTPQASRWRSFGNQLPI